MEIGYNQPGLLGKLGSAGIRRAKLDAGSR
jgi:hypothetical protein